jgi:ribosomal protein S18 acetylase RimI-like enzyme
VDTSDVRIRLLTPDDAEAYFRLRGEALADAPLSFTAAPGDDFVSSPGELRKRLATQPDSVIVGAFADSLIGAVGLVRESREKTRHKANLWGMYVSPSFRGRGVGGRLLDAAVEHARSIEGVTTVALAVSTAAEAARRMYESRGFVAWGLEPDALHWQGSSAGEHHMRLEVRR